MKSLNIQQLVSQTILIHTLIWLANLMGASRFEGLQQLQHQLALRSEQIIRESAAVEDVSFDEESKIRETAIANLHFAFGEARNELPAVDFREVTGGHSLSDSHGTANC
jgi:hypothetical protein